MYELLIKRKNNLVFATIIASVAPSRDHHVDHDHGYNDDNNGIATVCLFMLALNLDRNSALSKAWF